MPITNQLQSWTKANNNKKPKKNKKVKVYQKKSKLKIHQTVMLIKINSKNKKPEVNLQLPSHHQ